MGAAGSVSGIQVMSKKSPSGVSIRSVVSIPSGAGLRNFPASV